MKGDAMTLKELIKLKQADWGMRTLVLLHKKGLIKL